MVELIESPVLEHFLHPSAFLRTARRAAYRIASFE